MSEPVGGLEIGLELDRLKRIPAPPDAPDAPDDAAADEEQYLAEGKEQEEYLHQKEMHALERQSVRQDIRERKKYANKIFWMISVWLVAVFLLLILCGVEHWRCCGNEMFSFKLSDSVLLAIVGGTTANVLGLFIVVANYLFPNTKHQK